MGDMGDHWRDVAPTLKQESQDRRAKNRADSQRLLAEEGIDFTSANFGEHLVVVHHSVTFDFWPGTGKWTRRGSGKYSRGVANLIRAARALEPKGGA